MNTIRTLSFLCGATALAPLAQAQGLEPLTPFASHVDAYVTDSGSDRVMRLSDLDQDGDFDSPGEVVVFYDELQGTILLGNNNSVAVLPSGLVIVGDTSSDILLGLRDLDGDGSCHGPGEHFVWFDGDPLVNGSGIAMVSPNNLSVDAAGRVFVADANTGGGGLDAVLVIQDRNGDGDANDVGEARHYYVPLNGSGVGDVIPNSVAVMPTGDLLYLEGSSTGFATKGLYRLDDANRDGVIDPSTEVFFFWFPPTLPFNPFIWDVNIDATGAVYVADTGNDVIWRLVDTNGDGGIDSTTEQFLYYVSPTASLVWTAKPDEQGRLLVAESQNPDRVLLLDDADGNGVIAPGTEVATVYTSVGASVVIDSARGLCWRPAPRLEVRPTATVGDFATYRVFGAPGEAVLVLGSLAAAPATAVPFLGGLLELDTSVGARFVRVPGGDVGPNGGVGGRVRLPNDPALVGATLHLQGVLGGPSRRVLTNRATVALL
jgi:sugar lactone lactonase YvrE